MTLPAHCRGLELLQSIAVSRPPESGRTRVVTKKVRHREDQLQTSNVREDCKRSSKLIRDVVSAVYTIEDWRAVICVRIFLLGEWTIEQAVEILKKRFAFLVLDSPHCGNLHKSPFGQIGALAADQKSRATAQLDKEI